MNDKEFNLLSRFFGLNMTADRLSRLRVKRLFDDGDDVCSSIKRAKVSSVLSADVIALVADRLHDINVIRGRHVFLAS